MIGTAELARLSRNEDVTICREIWHQHPLSTNHQLQDMFLECYPKKYPKWRREMPQRPTSIQPAQTTAIRRVRNRFPNKHQYLTYIGFIFQYDWSKILIKGLTCIFPPFWRFWKTLFIFLKIVISSWDISVDSQHR